MVENVSTGAVVASGTITSTKRTLTTSTDSKGINKLKEKTEIFTDAACKTAAPGNMVYEYTYDYTLNNNGDNHSVKIYTSSFNKKTSLITYKISTESFPVQNIDMTLSGVSLTPVDLNAATGARLTYNTLTDKTGAVVASCASLVFTANNATDLVQCLKNSATIVNAPFSLGINMGFNGSMISWQTVYEAKNKHFFLFTTVISNTSSSTNLPQTSTESPFSTISGDNFYQP